MSSALSKTIVFGVLLLTGTAQGSEFGLHPSLAVSEEFTDNVFEARTVRVTDYITRLMPGLVMTYDASALTAHINYLFDFRHYVKNSRENETTHALNAKGHLTVIEDFMHLDVSDEYQRVSLDATRDVTSESLFYSQSDRNIVTVAPYLTFRLTERIPLKLGYRFIDTRYISSAAIDKTDHVVFADLAYELSKRFSLTANYTFSRELSVLDNYSQHHALGGFRYEYTDKSFLFAQAGNTWTSFDSGRNISVIAWNTGVTHAFDTVTATVTSGVKYNEDPLRNIMKESFVSASIEKLLGRGSLSFSPSYSVFDPTDTGSIKTKKYGATVRGQYELTPYLKGNLAFVAEKYEQQTMESYTRRIQVDSSLGYLLARELTVLLTHIYTGYYSPEIVADNWHVNRVMIELKKTF